MAKGYPGPSNERTPALTPWFGENAPSWWQPGPAERPREAPMGDWLQRYIINSLIPSLDPFTQRETAQWLARDQPVDFAPYANLNLRPQEIIDQPGGPGFRGFLTPERLDQVIQGLDFNTLAQNLPGIQRQLLQGEIEYGPQGYLKGIKPGTTNPMENQLLDLKSTLNWLTEALKTARMGLPGRTRADQYLAAKHLNTLFQEAEQEPERAGKFKTWFENFLNPVMRRPPLTGPFGLKRTLTAPRGEQRGLSFRNPTVT